MPKHATDLVSYWDRRQVNREMVGKIVDFAIYETHADKKMKGTFLIIYTDDLSFTALQLKKVDLNTNNEFFVFNGEMTHGEKNYHHQNALKLYGSHPVNSVRILNLEAMGGITDVEIMTLHTFSIDTPFENIRQIDGDSFNDIMISFFKNPVADLSEERIAREVYHQFHK